MSIASTARVLVTPRSLTAGGLDTPELEPLRARGLQIVTPRPGETPTASELAELLPGCVAWLAGVERIDAGVLACAPDLRVISRNGAGVDSIDLDEAARRGVTVVRAEGANAEGVAELTLTLILTALRHLPAATTALREGKWSRTVGAELADTTVGIVGLGAIGSRVAQMLSQLGAPVIGYDPYAAEGDVPVVELDQLLQAADVVSLHCPPAPGGRPVLDAARVARLRHGSVVVNTARSSLVDNAAVLSALEAGRLGYYAVDAYDTEPPPPSPLLSHPRVIATPHLGGFTRASVRRATMVAVSNLLRALDER